jgi:predicted nucleic-acid-binding protein
MRCLLDANLILRFLRDDDADHSPRARQLFEEAGRGARVLVIATPIITECVWVLRSFYKTGRGEIAAVLLALFHHPGVELDERGVLVDALSRFGTTNVDFADCYLAARAAASSEPVASFDEDFRRFSDVEMVNL